MSRELAVNIHRLFAAAALSLLASCGGGGGNTSTPAAVPAPAPTPTPAPAPPPSTEVSTGQITTYLSTSYGLDQTDLASAIQAMYNMDIPIEGCGGNVAVNAVSLKISNAQTFIANGIAFVASMKAAGLALDKPTIINLFQQYQAQDLKWVTGWAPTSPCGPLSGAAIQGLTQQLDVGIDQDYLNVTAQIDAL
jgi:hypothetical protein